MERKYNLYVLLTSTPLKTGKFIRKFTRFEYNHCSISFDKNFKVLYSFSRKHKNATFYAGLVQESSLRYTTNEEITKVQIFKIPLRPKIYRKIKKYLHDLNNHENEYIYNYLSLVTYPFHKKVKVRKAYTCCEFTVHILKDFVKLKELSKKDYVSIKKLSEILINYKIYEGPFNFENNSWEEDKYLEKQNVIYKSYKVIGIFSILLGRFLLGFIQRKKY